MIAPKADHGVVGNSEFLKLIEKQTELSVHVGCRRHITVQQAFLGFRVNGTFFRHIAVRCNLTEAFVRKFTGIRCLLLIRGQG